MTAFDCFGSGNPPVREDRDAGGNRVGVCGSCQSFVRVLTSGVLRNHKLPRGSEAAAVVTAAEDGSGAPVRTRATTESVTAAASPNDETFAADAVDAYDDGQRGAA